MAAKVTPSTPGAPSFSFASAYAARSVSILQTWTYKPQKRQDVSAFALTYSLRLRSCKLMDAFVISSLPSRLKEKSICSSNAPTADLLSLEYAWRLGLPHRKSDHCAIPLERLAQIGYAQGSRQRAA